MSLAETAVLAVELKLAGASQFKAGIGEADAAAAGLGKTVAATSNFMGTTASKMSLVKQAAVSTGAAIGGMASHFKNVITGPLGLIGLGAGLFTLTSALEKSIGKAEEFGRASEDLAKVTGLNISTASSLVDVLDKYGIAGDKQIKTLGMLEKNVGNLTVSQKTYNKFLADYGFALKDANGHTLDANALLLKASDYFNGSATASQKAAVMAKLFGRSWQDLIPVLSLGSKGIKQETADAIHLTDAQLDQLAKFRVAQRDWADSLGDLQTLVGVDLLPTLTDGLKGLTSWLEAHRDDVRQFFRDGLQFAKEMGAVLTDTVIPTIRGLATAAQSFWNAIPAPLRDILVKGFIADRTVHFLFGVSPLNLGKNLIGDIIGPILGRIGGGFLQRGGTPANPLFVADVTGGLGGGGVASGAGGLLSNALKLAIPVIAGLAVAAAWKSAFQDPGLLAQTNQNSNSATNMINNKASTADLITALDGAKQGLHDLTNTGLFQPVIDALYGSQIQASKDLVALIQAELDRRSKPKPSERHFDVTNRKTEASYMETHRGEIGDLLVDARNPASAIATLPGHIKALQHALVNATGANARHIAAEIKAEKIALKTAIETQKKTASHILKTGAQHDKDTSTSISDIIKAAAKRGGNILSAGAQRDAETSAAIAQINKLADSSDIERLQSKTSTGLTAAARAATSAGAGVIGAIRANRPITNVQVNVSATSVSHTTTVVTRYGPTGGSRNTSSNYSTNPGK